MDGFDALAPLDSNGDDRVDASDPAFAALRIWRDINANGVSDAGELLTTAEAGIRSFNLIYAEVDRDVAGNTLARLGSYTRLDGSARDMGSVWFTLDQRTTLPEVPVGTDMRPLLALPNLAGSASVPDLRTAMTLDSGLKAMVEGLTAGDFDFGTLRAFMAESFEPLLFRWFGVDGPPPVDEENKPRYMRAIEALTGQPIPLDDLNSHQRERLSEVGTQWGNVVVSLAIQFLVQAAQTPLHQAYLDAGDAILALDSDATTFADQFNTILATLDAELIAAEPPSGLVAPFALLSIDPVTGKPTGDFDAFVAEILRGQPSFWSDFHASAGAGAGSMFVTVWGTEAEYSHPWTEWYQKQGIFLFNVAALLEIESDYVVNVTGWRWLFGEASDHHGTINNDILDYTETYFLYSNNHGSVPTSDQRVFGYEGNDELRGNAGVDRLVGGSGDDILKGGSDSDMYVYAAGDGLDRIIEESGSSDAIYFSSEFDAANLQVARITGTDDLLLHFGDPTQGIVLANQWASSAIEQIHFVAEDGLNAGDIASRYLATLATAGADEIAGSWAGERLIGFEGDDTLYGLDGSDILDGGQGADALFGGNGDDVIQGGTGNDALYGEGGLDTLHGGLGDWLDGSTQADTYLFNVGDGNDRIFDYKNYWDGDDAIIFGAGITADGLVLTRVDRHIRIGFLGSTTDSLQIEHMRVDTVHDIERIQFADGTVWNQYQLFAEYIRQQKTSGDDVILGTTAGDTIEGGAGNDALYGEGGADMLHGGLGDDTIFEDSGNDVYVWNMGDGDDRLIGGGYWDGSDTLRLGAGVTSTNLAVSYSGNAQQDVRLSFYTHAGSITLGDWRWNVLGIEQIEFADGTVLSKQQILDRAISATDLADTINGSDGNDVIRALAGDDEVHGAAGNDVLEGNIGDDRLFGDAGNDRLDGGLGSDTMTGGAGNDVYIVDAVTDQVIEAASAGTNRVATLLTYTLVGNVENLTLSGAAAINGTGNTLANILTGNSAANNLAGAAGNDTISGGAGNDVLSGGSGSDAMLGEAGDDIYSVDSLGDLVTELLDEGYDSVTASIAYTLPDNVEKLVLTGAARSGTGNNLDNLLNGSTGADTLAGMGGNDVLQGLDGDDTIDGGIGNDTLYGGVGVDLLTGSAGADRFTFRSGEAGNTSALADKILDYSRADGDRIVVSLIDAKPATTVDDVFTFLGTGAFTGSAGQLRYQIIGSDTFVQGDLDGDSTADIFIQVSGSIAFVAGDFVL